jgi:OmpA-OmpF porin, OOP family
MRIAIACVVLAGLIGAHTAAAQQNPTREEIIKGLSSKPKGPMRGLAVEEEGQTGDRAGVIDLYVQFDYNSAQLTPESYTTLNTLAEAFGAPELASAAFIVAGHTDSRGQDAYNLALSERRAQSVANYLVGAKGIDKSRLTIVGKGENEPLDKANTEAAVNRRVEIRNLSLKQ